MLSAAAGAAQNGSWRRARVCPISNAAMQPIEPQPGSEFLQRRLQKALAVPQAQRSPDVAAFIESSQLLREVQELLPASLGEALLPRTAENERRVALAFALAAKASYLCLEEPVAPGALPHLVLNEYMDFLEEHPFVGQPFGGGGGGRPGGGNIASHAVCTGAILTCFTNATVAARTLNVEMCVDAVAACDRLVKLLGEPPIRSAVDRQLAALQAGRARPLTAQQLQVACACVTLKVAAPILRLLDCLRQAGRRGVQLPQEMDEPTAQLAAWSPQQWEATATAIAEAAALVQRLEPNSPKCCILAAGAAETVRHEEACGLYVRAIQLAQRSGSDLQAVSATVLLLNALLNTAEAERSRSAAKAAVAALPAAQQALRRCKRVLPNSWVAGLEAQLPYAAVQCAALKRALAGASAEAAAMLRAPAAQQAVENIAPTMSALEHCSCCQLRAIGLRLCARCKATRYCRCAGGLAWGPGPAWSSVGLESHSGPCTPHSSSPCAAPCAARSARRSIGRSTRPPAARQPRR